MRIDRQQREPNAIVTTVVVSFDALDCSTALALVQDDRLIVNDAIAIKDMRVDASGEGAPSWVDTCVIEVSGRVKRHHVGGGLVTPSPEFCDRDFLLKLDYTVVGAA
jgi:hypothetical protein